MEHSTSSAIVSDSDLESLFKTKYGDPASGSLGWGPILRLGSKYFTPDDHYETVLNRLITERTKWLDVGCGRRLFPSNDTLAQELSARCESLVGLDPDKNVLDNPYAHRKILGTTEDLSDDERFNLVTFRMVAEHVEHPDRLVEKLSHVVESDGLVVIYTVNKYSPVPIMTKAVPFALHHGFKKVLWGTEKRDTFPVFYRMNTRKTLKEIFQRGGFNEYSFQYLDDCRTFGHYKMLLRLELSLMRTLKAMNTTYPENCLLGIYQRT